MLRAPTSRRELRELVRRDHTLLGGLLFGLDGFIIEVQARAIQVSDVPLCWHGSKSVRAVKTISGMTWGALSEVLSRISGAFSKLDIPPPQTEIIVNLAPADLLKEGTWLDLPLAVILLQAAGMLPDLPEDMEDDYILVGELGLHGEIRRVPGALSIAYEAKPGQKLIVPAGNEKECALILAKPGHEGCGVFPVSTLQEVIDFFAGRRKLDNALKEAVKFENAVNRATDFGRIKGQSKAKRAAVISAAGGHNMLLIGPPGEGKSMIAKAMPGILPRLTDAEKVELTRIYSASGQLEKDGLAVTRRPMRSVHHGASRPSLVGGGSGIPTPGEVTLAHLGVLFLDEFAEFPRSNLEALRQPLEDGKVTVTRVQASLTFPCQCTLVAAMNPCPCGYFGDDRCKCSPRDISAYLQKISGPLLDRIDLQVELQSLSIDERFAETNDSESAPLRAQVQRARQIQNERFAGTEVPFNSAIPGGHVAEYVSFSKSGFDSFKLLIESSELSTRSMDRLAKVSRTIADLDESPQVEPKHLDEAASFVIGGILRDSF